MDTEDLNLSKMELSFIKKALEKHQNNKTKAANELGITVKTLYNKLHYHKIFQDYASARKEAKKEQGELNVKT